ncbi:hypothetical protein H0266_15145 [Halobacillus locisalis]|uniref:Uncharacterized protein n=1 Tax=Halobacillus locisalis TaxID=220753 RepID=A0A838CVQ7_9BACI|nr:hypothetical protein [Halobacillus locisalis]MBA2176232.1 hypothetical protein [Halobacillus locisalis]
MELVKKKPKIKLRETRLGVVSFICALLTLGYLNIFLLSLEGYSPIANLFLQIIPTTGIITGLLSLVRVRYRKTFTWWAFGLYGFMFVCVLVIGFIEFATYTKP